MPIPPSHDVPHDKHYICRAVVIRLHNIRQPLAMAKSTLAMEDVCFGGYRATANTMTTINPKETNVSLL